MFGSTVLDAAIGVAFVFMILSILASSAREILEGWLQTRAIHLERGIRELLDDKAGEGWAEELYRHPLVSSLYTGEYKASELLTGRTFQKKDSAQRVKFRSNLPAYVPALNFARALVDIAARGSPAVAAEGGSDAASPAEISPLSLGSIREGIAAIENAQVQRGLLIALDQSRGNLDLLVGNVAQWFDSGMDRVSGRYRKETQWVLLAIGLVTAVALNVDAIRLGSHLYTTESARAVVVAEAQALITADSDAVLDRVGCPANGGKAAISCQQDKLDNLGLPLGWQDGRPEWRSVALSIPGWLLTALAITLGAPFWFDVLNKFMVIRSTVKPHEKSPEESSEDRQFPKPPSVQTSAAMPAGAPGAVAAPVIPADSFESDESHPPPDMPADEEPPPTDPGFVPHEWKGSGDPQEGVL